MSLRLRKAELLKMSKKIVKFIPAIVGVVLYISLMIYFAFFDLDISIALYNKESLFGKILEAIGEVPFTLIALLGFNILFFTRQKEKKFLSIFIAVISVVGILAYSFLLVFFVLNYLKVKGALIYGFSFMLPIAAGSFFGARALSKRYGSSLKRVAIIAILTILIEQAVTYALKYAWGRPRMRDLLPPYDGFFPWYSPNWWSGSDSFPSGHSANAACVIVLSLLPVEFCSKKKTGEIIASVLCYLWLIIVMVSRVVAGAHFASDVTTGAFITLLAFYCLKARFYKRKDAEAAK